MATSKHKETPKNMNIPKVETDKELAQKKLEYQRERDKEMLKGKFHFYEVPGGSTTFVYRRYKGDPVEQYTLVDGQIYTLPRGVVRHLVDDGNYPIHEYLLDENGKKVARVGRRVNRFGFESTEFMDLEGKTSSGVIDIVDEVTNDDSFRKIY